MAHVLAKVRQELTKLEIPRDRIHTIVGLSMSNWVILEIEEMSVSVKNTLKAFLSHHSVRQHH